MIHHDLRNHILRNQLRSNFVYPYYGKYSIAEIVPSVLRNFGIPSPRTALPEDFFGGVYNKILFFIVDGFGYNHLKEFHHQLPFFDKIVTHGDIYPLTSIFPSTTPAALTTLHTGLTPQEHGLPEWTVYFSEFERIIETLPFRTQLTQDRENLLKEGGNPEMLYRGRTVYEDLKDAGIKSYIFIYHEYADGAYTSTTQKGSYTIPFSNISDLIVKLKHHMHTVKEKAYFVVYWGDIDSTAHSFGPKSKEHISAMNFFSDHFNASFLKTISPRDSENILLLLTADHGQVNIRREEIIYLNAYLNLEENYQWSSHQTSILPTGAPHDVFLYIYPPKLEEILAFLREELAGKAEVLEIQRAIEGGLFGIGKPTERFLRRVGNVLILPHSGYHIWYEFAPDKPWGQLGIHGGLSEDEMLVPFGVAKLADLIG